MAKYRIPVSRASLWGVLLACGVALSGCGGTQAPYLKPTFPFLASYKQAKPAAPVLLANAAWWRQMDDPSLNALVDLAMQDNLTLKIARERVVAARAELHSVPGSTILTSSADLRGEGTGSDGPDLRAQAQLGLSWMLDPWGARRDQLRAAGARVEVADAEVDAARLLLLFNLSLAHVDLRYRQQLLALSHRELAASNRTLRQTRTLLRASEATRLDVTRAEARRAQIRANIPRQQADIKARINELTVLTGRAPGQLPVSLAQALIQSKGQPRARMSPQVGIPADLLRNRPDIRIAERSYYAAVNEVGVARAALYPSLSLTGLITLNSLNSGSNRPEYFFGPTVAFPSLPLTNARARVTLRASQARQAHEGWKDTVLGAILEVENALLEYNAATSALSSAAQAARLYRQTERLTRDLLDRGEATVSDLIEAGRDVADADRVLADLVQQHARSFVEINVRLGAGHGLKTVVPRSVPKGTADAVVVSSRSAPVAQSGPQRTDP